MKIEASELRYGNVFEYLGKDNLDERKKYYEPTYIDWQDIRECAEDNETFNKWHRPIPLTEDILLKCGFEVINENSAGKRYGIVENHIFNSDTILVYWDHNKDAGKIFRGDMEIKSLHQLQNLIHALTGKELEINL